jgi:hypothetical protein
MAGARFCSEASRKILSVRAEYSLLERGHSLFAPRHSLFAAEQGISPQMAGIMEFFGPLGSPYCEKIFPCRFPCFQF